MRRTTIIGLAVLASAVGADAGIAQEQPFRENDAGGFRDVLPPGTNGSATGLELAAFLTMGARPAHNDDQLAMYERLVYGAPGVHPGDLARYYKDASFGVAATQVARRYSPRGDVVILRDREFGVPHVYGATRDGALFGLGYVAAEDRMFLMDALRHIGRGRLSSFAGGASGNRELDRDQWIVAPYTEQDLERQIEQFDDLYGDEGAQVQRDVANYVAGVNARIAEMRLDPTKTPGEYAAIGRPQGPEPWRGTDIIATAALVGGVLGKGGGGEVGDAELLRAFRKRFGRRTGTRLWEQFGGYDDPEAPTTVARRRFPYGGQTGRRRGLALPDPGSVRPHEPVAERTGGAAERGGAGILDGLLRQRAASNALLISARESESGSPLAVFGPQTGYFAPQLLMEQDVHAPASAAGPGIDARGAAFPGTNLYVQLGRGRDYAWSGTSAGQDIIDTFALELCRPDGVRPAVVEHHYLFRGECLPMEELRRTNCWEPSLADQTPRGCETLAALRTRLGLVRSFGTVKGRPVAFAELRSTYMHEIDSAIGFLGLNDPAAVRGVRDFQRAASRILYTFNWFYLDERDIGYVNSGANPVRARGVDMRLPVHGRPAFEWRGFDPERNTMNVIPFEAHPQAVNPRFLANWNNKQAPGHGAATFGGYPPVHRVDILVDRADRGTHGRRRMSLVDLVDQVQDAATVDLRGQEVLPWVLRVIGRPDRRRPADRAVASALNVLRAWAITGAHRRDRNASGTYEHSEAILYMDAWWEPMLRAIFEPALGPELMERMRRRRDFDDANRDDHVGSAFETGWFGYVQKDLRTLLGRRVEGRYARSFCGRGSLKRCRRALLRSLREAMDVPPEKLYADAMCPDERFPDLQMCSEAIAHGPTGGITQPLIHWMNRPTYQQAVEVRPHGAR